VDFLFRIVFQPGSDQDPWQKAWDWFGADIHFTAQWLNEWGFKTEFNFASHQMLFSCIAPPPSLSEKEARQIGIHALCSALSDFFVDKLENELLIHLLRHTYGYERLDELKSLCRYCEEVLYGEKDFSEASSEIDEKVDRRKQMIYQQAYYYLEEADRLHLEGFFRFRLKEYQQLLHEAIWQAIDKFAFGQNP